MNFFGPSCHAQHEHNVLTELLRNSSDLAPALDKKREYEIQIIYTSIDRDKHNRPQFKTYHFNVDPNSYFYPASTVKLSAVLLSLEKVNGLKAYNVDEYTPMFHDSVYSGQSSIRGDSTAADGCASIAHYSKKILVVSDNAAFNRLYEFLGQDYFNQRLYEMGYTHTRITHRLERFLTRDENRHTEAVGFVRNDSVLFAQPMQVNAGAIEPPEKIFRGRAFYRNDSLIQSPFEFTYKNAFPLGEQHLMLMSIVFPTSVPATKRFQISDEQRRFVLKYMSQLPRETTFPPYYRDTSYNDASVKFLMFGGSSEIPKHIRVFNKVGDAYGYLVDNAYIVDFKNGVEFLLSAVINTNTDEVYNDGQYDYEKLGFPFMRNLGNVIYNYELKRTRAIKPDLSEFRFEYDR